MVLHQQPVVLALVEGESLHGVLPKMYSSKDGASNPAYMLGMTLQGGVMLALGDY